MSTYSHYSQVSLFCGRDVVDNARQQIDKEIQDLYKSLCNLKSRRNTLASVSRLPPEVLYKIFASLAGREQADHSYFNNVISGRQVDYGGTNLLWIKISHVCRHWRSVALDCPRLWSSIVFARPSWAEEMLKRSKAAPLVLKADLTHMTPKMVDALQLALQHISRTKQLHLSASRALLEKLVDGLSNSAPYLQSLCLTSTRHSPYLLDSDLYTLPESLFNGDAPRLRRLHLTECNLRWDSPLLGGLTQLQIHRTSIPARPTIEQLLAALGRMPLLQTLDLEEALPSLPRGAAPASVAESPVALSHLSSLRLGGLLFECATFLNHITFPPMTRLQLICDKGNSTHSFSSLHPAITSIWHGKEGCKALHSFMVQKLAPGTIRLQGWTTSGVDLLSRPAQISLTLIWRLVEEGNPEQVVKDICTNLSLAQLRTLAVCNVQMQKSSWVEAFGSLTKLHTIRVQGLPVYGLVLALGEKQTKGRQRRNGHPPKGIVFPVLHKLVIEDTEFYGGAYELMDRLMDMLMERSEMKVEVQELRLLRCYQLVEEDVNLLKELVVDVFWDGVEQGFDHSDEYSEEESYYSDYYSGSEDFTYWGS